MTIEERDDNLPGGGRMPTLKGFRELTGEGGPLCAKWCEKCDKHYHYCECESPRWRLRNEGKLGPMPNEPGGPTSLRDMMDRKNREMNRQRYEDGYGE